MILTRTWIALSLAIATTAAHADGRMYAKGFTPEIPDQRALIAFDGARQVMLIENRVALPDGGQVPSIGWVVPVPAVPEIAVADRTTVRRLYTRVRSQSDPDTLPVAPIVLVLVPLAFVYAIHLRRLKHPDARPLRLSAWIGLMGSLLALVSLSTPMPSGRDSGVEVVKALRSGPADAKVVRAPSGAELVDWLKSNGYDYGKGDIEAVDEYLRRNWLFVAARLVPEPGAAFEGPSASPPLVLSFPTSQPVYPLALTAAGGRSLDLVLYVFASMRLEPSVAMHTAFAGTVATPAGMFSLERDKAAAVLFGALSPAPFYLTKLVRRIPANELRQDIRFTGASAKGNFQDWALGPMFTFWVGGAALVALAAFLLQVGGRGRWHLSGPAWFAISMFLSPLALLALLARAVRQYRENRDGRLPDSTE